MGDLEKTDIARPGHVGAAAKFLAYIPHLDHPNYIAVLFVKDGSCPRLDGILDRKDRRGDGEIPADKLIGQCFYGSQVLFLNAGKVGKIETESLGIDQR